MSTSIRVFGYFLLFCLNSVHVNGEKNESAIDSSAIPLSVRIFYKSESKVEEQK